MIVDHSQHREKTPSQQKVAERDVEEQLADPAMPVESGSSCTA